MLFCPARIQSETTPANTTALVMRKSSCTNIPMCMTEIEVEMLLLFSNKAQYRPLCVDFSHYFPPLEGMFFGCRPHARIVSTLKREDFTSDKPISG